ncbi:MAG: hypothetical protein LBN93_07120 [Candidatus Symbiothrix sp.]|jgi:hypothetical protein|nr:hypothetical protein [Candidatus Symbiothrix sp.]
MIQKRIAQLKEVLLRAQLQVVLSIVVFLLFFLAHNNAVQAQTSTYPAQETTQITTILADCRQDVKLTNQTPTQQLLSGLPVLAGDFPIVIQIK